MKKILLFLGVALLSMSINAAPVTPAKKFTKANNLQTLTVKAPNAEFSAMKTLKAQAPQAKQATDTIMIAGISQIAYYATEFYFVAKLGKSALYDFSLFNEEGYYIAAGMFYGSGMDTITTKGNYGLFSFRSNYILNYGENYEDLEEYVQEYIAEGDMESAAQIAEVAASWKQQWMEHVTAVDYDEESGEYSYALKPGTYFIAIEGYNSTGRTKTEEADFAPFMVQWLSVSNMNAEVSEDKNTAAFTWELPENYADTIFQLYVGVYDSEGEKVFSNYDQEGDTLTPVSSPLTLNVEEGKTYTATVQILTKDGYEAGLAEDYIFTVGESTYAPKNLAATVLETYGDSVQFTWAAEEQPAAFGIEIYYKSGEYLAQYGYEEGDVVLSGGPLQSYGVGAALPPGTYTWAVVAYLYDGQYLNYASEYIQGPEFTTVDLGAPIITGYAVETEAGSTSTTITFEVDDNYYTADDMTFHVSGDLTGEWTTTNGAYTIEDLEVGKEYHINVSVEDPAGNINELAITKITFTAGEAKEAIDQVIFDIKANKVLRDGQLIIKRDKKAFNALGAEL